MWTTRFGNWVWDDVKTYVALLRAVNVGGTGKLPMSELKAMCEKLGFAQVRTYIASGNVVFKSKSSADKVRSLLERALAAYAGKPVGVLIREASELADVLARNPFPHHPGNRVMVLFADEPLSPKSLTSVRAPERRRVAAGKAGNLHLLSPRNGGDATARPGWR